ncbi:unnamed protein product, partial [Owenia fusiformis]
NGGSRRLNGPLQKCNLTTIFEMTIAGQKKKFLYSGPVRTESPEEDQWDFATKNRSPATSGGGFDLDDVWSIKKNVHIGNGAQRNTDNLTLNVSKGHYSRHGVIKDDEFSNTLNAINTSSNTGTGGGRSWNQPNKSNFSYSYAQQPSVPPSGQISQQIDKSPKPQTTFPSISPIGRNNNSRESTNSFASFNSHSTGGSGPSIKPGGSGHTITPGGRDNSRPGGFSYSPH